ncbi:MAG: hypothetical protein Q4F31_08395, partial [Eubacteriales bacterium]|nr:hypothetical protein [Eubacteriales bacterium]
MKFTAKLLSVVLVLAMVMSMGVFAFAGDGGSATIDIVKNVHKPDQSATSAVEMFKFIFTPVTYGETPTGYPINAPLEISDQTINFEGSETYDYISESKDYVAKKTFSGAYVSAPDLMHAMAVTSLDEFEGKILHFEWVVSEEKGTTEGMTYDPTRYLLVLSVSVQNGGIGSYNYTFYSEDGEEKVENMTFNNTYLKPAADRLTIRNHVQDSAGGAIPNKAFAYTMTVNKPDLWPEESFSYSIFDKDGNLLSDLSGTAKFGEALTFNLDDGYCAKFVLPEGCTYDVLESGQKNYKPSVSYGDGTEVTTKDITLEGNYDENLAIPATGTKNATANQIRVANDGSHADFTNVKRDVSPTGL